MSGALFEERSDGSDLGLHAGIVGEHVIDRLPRIRCEARLAPERLRAIPQGIPCRQVGRIAARLEALPGDGPTEFHERPRTERLHLRLQRVHGLAHPVAFAGCVGQPHTRRIVEPRSLALAEQPQSLAAKFFSRVDLRVQVLRPGRGRIQAMTAVPQERLDPAAGLLVIGAQPLHRSQGRRLRFQGPRLHRPAHGFREFVAPQRLRPLHELRRPRHGAGIDPQTPRVRFMESHGFAEPCSLVEPEALCNPPECRRDPRNEARHLLHPAAGLLQRRALGQPRRMLRQIG